MLIVVIIVGILSAAILPRLTGYMARTRDLQRHMDLRNIAAAIELYKSNKGKWPEIYDKNNKVISDFAWRVTWLLWIKEYINEIPKDPSNLFVWNILNDRHRIHFTQTDYHLLDKWDYLYISTRSENSIKVNTANGALLFTKVETPEYANYIKVYPDTVFVDSRNRLGGVFWRANHSKINETERRSFPSYIDHNALHLCTSVKKADAPTMNKKDDGTVECTYSDPEQLYYIVKVDG